MAEQERYTALLVFGLPVDRLEYRVMTPRQALAPSPAVALALAERDGREMKWFGRFVGVHDLSLGDEDGFDGTEEVGEPEAWVRSPEAYY